MASSNLYNVNIVLKRVAEICWFKLKNYYASNIKRYDYYLWELI